MMSEQDVFELSNGSAVTFRTGRGMAGSDSPIGGHETLAADAKKQVTHLQTKVDELERGLDAAKNYMVDISKSFNDCCKEHDTLQESEAALKVMVARLRQDRKVAFIQGYESGHNDTVESAYWDSEEKAEEWLVDAIEDGTIFNTPSQSLQSFRDEIIEECIGAIAMDKDSVGFPEEYFLAIKDCADILRNMPRLHGDSK